jgi:hypothetical protein
VPRDTPEPLNTQVFDILTRITHGVICPARVIISTAETGDEILCRWIYPILYLPATRLQSRCNFFTQRVLFSSKRVFTSENGGFRLFYRF